MADHAPETDVFLFVPVVFLSALLLLGGMSWYAELAPCQLQATMSSARSHV